MRRVATAAGDVIAYLHLCRSLNRTIETLSALDDARLKDIGLTRDEIVAWSYRHARTDWQNWHR